MLPHIIEPMQIYFTPITNAIQFPAYRSAHNRDLIVELLNQSNHLSSTE